MDFENHKNKCSKKILARNASMRCSSSRIYYYGNSGEGVPFKWEMQPGIAKDPPKQDLLPPLSPPPALLSLGLPKPCFEFEEPKPSTLSRLRFWKKRNSKRSQECSRYSFTNGLDVFAGLEFSSDSDSMASPSGSSFSSSSSSSMWFTKTRPPLQSTSSESQTREIYGKPLSCFPMHISKILVSIARRD